MKIKNEVIDQLPITRFDGTIEVVDNFRSLRTAIREMHNYDLFGFDTETRPTFTRGAHHSVALLQLSTVDKTWLFRLSKIGFPPEVVSVMSSRATCKAGLAIRDDLKALQERAPFVPAKCVDVQHMAQKMNVEELSLKKMAALVLGVHISKKERLTNWENDVLTSEQLLYAATDSWISLLLYQALSRGETVHPRVLEILSNTREERQI